MGLGDRGHIPPSADVGTQRYGCEGRGTLVGLRRHEEGVAAIAEAKEPHISDGSCKEAARWGEGELLANVPRDAEAFTADGSAGRRDSRAARVIRARDWPARLDVDYAGKEQQALEHFGGGLGASKVGDEGDFCHMCHMCKNPATCGVRAPGSGVELDRQAGLAGQCSLLLHFLAPSSDEGLIVGFRMLSVPVS